MRELLSIEEFRRDPIGAYICAGPAVVWCSSPTLGGVVVWGNPTAEETLEVTRCLDAFPNLPGEFSVVLDGSALTGVDPAALGVLLGWTRRNLADLGRRVVQRVGVIPDGIHGLTLAGITAVLGGPGPDRIAATARDGLRLLCGADGDALCDEIEGIVSAARRTPPWLLQLRDLLIACQGTLALGDAARQLRLSSRTLQRGLAEQGTSYRAEQREARFLAASRLLQSNEKLAVVASRLGLSETGLALLVRRQTGLPPGAYRERERAGGPGAPVLQKA